MNTLGRHLAVKVFVSAALSLCHKNQFLFVAFQTRHMRVLCVVVVCVVGALVCISSLPLPLCFKQAICKITGGGRDNKQ